MSGHRDYGEVLRCIIGAQNGIRNVDLAVRMGVSESTPKRLIATLRREYKAPISSDRRGYHWRPAPHEKRLAEALIIVFCER